jgi:hypothetical protein
MIGKLHRKGDHWVIRYKMEDDLIATDGGEISLHPDDEIFLMGVKEWNDDDIHFKIVPFMHDTFVAKIIDEDDESPEPNEALKSAKERYDKHIPPYVSDDFQIGPDGAYENVDEWDPDFMDGKNEDTWFDELDINPHWKKHLKKYNLSPEIWNVICRLYYGETIALKQSLEEERYWIHKYNILKKNIKNLLD